jgi:hypothetical protein
VWTDGTPITFTKWAKGQPDGKTPQGDPEHCLVTNFEEKNIGMMMTVLPDVVLSANIGSKTKDI